MHVVGQDVSGGVDSRLAATHPEDVIRLSAIESGLADFGVEGLADTAEPAPSNVPRNNLGGVRLCARPVSATQRLLAEIMDPIHPLPRTDRQT